MSAQAILLSESSLAERHRARVSPSGPVRADALERQNALESSARSYPRRFPLVLKRGQGVYVEDIEGRVFIDCLAGAGALALGHNHPATVDALRAALASELPWQTLDLMSPVKDEFMQELFGTLPPSWAGKAKIQFCGPTGSDAIEAALKLVKTATGRSTVLSFQGAYHGMTQGSLNLMGNLEPKRALATTSGVQFLPFPYDYRCPFGLGGDAGESAGLNYIANLLEDPESGVLPPAAVILEVVQGEGGAIPASKRWLKGLRDACSKAAVPFIVDEVQTGLGRTGRWFAFEHADITPDVLVLSKAVGGGLPLSVVLYDRALDLWRPGAHAGTFRGNQLAMATGIATIRYIRQNDLLAHVEAMGKRLRGHLLELQARHDCVGDVRGQGLMLGMEIVDTSGKPDMLGHPPPFAKRAAAIQRGCLDHGLIVEVGGRQGATLRLLPPLVIQASEVDAVAGIIGKALLVSRL